MASSVRFASVADAHIAYQTHGSGPPLHVVYLGGFFSHIDITLGGAAVPALHRRSRSLRPCDSVRQTRSGVSDPLPADAGETWEAYVDDLKAVLGAAGSERAAIFATNAIRRACVRPIGPPGLCVQLRATASQASQTVPNVVPIRDLSDA